MLDQWSFPKFSPSCLNIHTHPLVWIHSSFSETVAYLHTTVHIELCQAALLCDSSIPSISNSETRQKQMSQTTTVTTYSAIFAPQVVEFTPKVIPMNEKAAHAEGRSRRQNRQRALLPTRGGEGGGTRRLSRSSVDWDFDSPPRSSSPEWKRLRGRNNRSR